VKVAKRSPKNAANYRNNPSFFQPFRGIYFVPSKFGNTPETDKTVLIDILMRLPKSTALKVL